MNRRKNAGLIAMSIASMAIAGCTTVTSRTVQLSRGVAGANDGVTYFLPRQLATVTAKRTESKLAKAITGVATAQTAVAEGQTAVAAAEGAVARARTALADADDNDTARRVRAEELAEAQADLSAARRDLATRQTKLTTATDTLRTTAAATNNAGPGAYDVSLSISLLPPSADPNFAYRLSPRHSALRDDEHKLTVSSAGLLATTNTIATDRTADILTEIATFAGAILGPVPPAGTLVRSGRDEKAPKDCTGAPDEFTGIVDFADRFDVARLNDDLQCLGVRVAVEGRNWPQSSQPVANPQDEIEGIVYRTPVDLLVRIEKCTVKEGTCGKAADGSLSPDLGWYPTQVIALNLPQAGPMSVVRQDAGLMTKSHYTLAFDSGMLTSYDASRPSELLEVARTPMRLVGGFFDGISKVISLRTGQANNLATLSTAELAYANALAGQQRGGVINQRLMSVEELALANQLAAADVAAITNQRQLSEAQQLQLQQAITMQYAEQIATFRAQQNLATANRDSLQTWWQLQSAGLTGQTQLTADQLALLNQQTTFGIAQVNAPQQLFQAQVTHLLNQQRQEEIRQCVLQQIAAGQPVNICVPTP